MKLLGAKFGRSGTTAAGSAVVEDFAQHATPACTRSTAPG